jgi:p-hydroxybenzoate 3-monooxygenase
MRTQIAIIGAGPAGMMLGHLLRQAGIDCLVLERRDRGYVEGRVRAGVIEQTTVEIMQSMGLADRLKREGLPHDGFSISWNGELIHIDAAALTGKRITVYGQQEIMHDLFDAAPARGIDIVFGAEDVALYDIENDKPFVTWRAGGEKRRIDCDFIAGCDGFHGASRACIPSGRLVEYEKIYPFGWLGVLADVPPCSPEVVYAAHERGFALASMRSATRSRYYVQVGAEDRLEDWPEDRFWSELAIRLGEQIAANLQKAPAIETAMAPLRSFVCEPMRYGRLLLAVDAAHIVPPTGAKGLNLAASDALFLSGALIEYCKTGSMAGVDAYSGRALARVWKAERFSWWFTHLTHRFPTATAIERKLQMAEMAYLARSRPAQASLAENYVGLPLGWS